MFQKIWDFLGDLRLTFWLLMAAAACLFVGAVYTNAHYSLFQTLNAARVQDWLAQQLPARLSLVWWLPVLFGVMALLGLNIFICACKRIAVLFAGRQSQSASRFLLRLAPSIIHLLFLFILFGHLLTFAWGKWERVPLEAGKPVALENAAMDLMVHAIQNEYFPDDTIMGGRISQTTVMLGGTRGASIRLSHLQSVAFEGGFLFLDMKKQKRGGRAGKKLLPVAAETCNKAPVYRVDKQKNTGKLLLLRVADPGFYIIVSGFCAILVVMITYFLAQVGSRRTNGGGQGDL